MKRVKINLDRNNALHLYEQAANGIGQYISNSGLKPNDSLPSTAEIARLLSLNHLTVRRALQKLADQGVVTIVPCRGIFVGAGAFEKRILWVGGLDLANGDVSSFYTDGLRMFREKFRALGYVMDYAWLPNEKDKCDPYCKPDVLEKYRGFVFYGGYENHPVLRYVIYNNAPYVHFVPGSAATSHTVTSPSIFAAMCRSLEYFADRGHPRVQIIKIVSPLERPGDLDAVRAKAQSLNIRVRLHQVPVCFRKSDYIRLADQLTASLLDEGGMPPAICVTDDILARGVSIRLLNHGIGNLPGLDLLVMAGRQEVIHLGLPVTYLTWDVESAVARGVAMLREQLTGRDLNPPSVVFPYEFDQPVEQPPVPLQLEAIELV